MILSERVISPVSYTHLDVYKRQLTGQLEPLGGSFAFGDRVDIGYFEQQMAQYTSDKTVLEDFWEEFPDLKRLEVRSWLGAFLFGQEEVFKKIDMLSGGEKVRLALAKIFRRLPNYLILDEPTNHMDIVGKESLEACLLYTSTAEGRYFPRV